MGRGLASILLGAGLAFGGFGAERAYAQNDAAAMEKYMKIHAESSKTKPEFKKTYKGLENIMGLYAIEHANNREKEQKEFEEEMKAKTGQVQQQNQAVQQNSLESKSVSEQPKQDSASSDTMDRGFHYQVIDKNDKLISVSIAGTQYYNEKTKTGYVVSHNHPYLNWLKENKKKDYALVCFHLDTMMTDPYMPLERQIKQAWPNEPKRQESFEKFLEAYKQSEHYKGKNKEKKQRRFL